MLNATLKLYGLTKDEILSEISKLSLDNKVKVYVKEKYKDAFVFVESKDEGELINARALITRCFSEHFYADRDISLYERLYEAIEARNVTISLFEQATGGTITQNLMMFNGTEKRIKVSYVLPSIKEMINHFDLNPFKLTVNHGICGEIAFDIAKHMRERFISDIYVVLVSTLAEGNELYYNSGEVAYAAIGTKNGVSMLKIEKSGDTKRDFMNQIAKTVCFKLIKILG